MAELIETSHESLRVIPSEHVRILHNMYEDNDLDGAETAKDLIDFLEEEAPGSFVGILANDSVHATCDSWEPDHYNCEYYSPYWYTFLISKKIWDEHADRVEAADQAWKDSHGCKFAKKS